jgi:hypothetical protein
LPHLLWLQSAGQDTLVSPFSQRLLPQVLAGLQSFGQEVDVSPLSHFAIAAAGLAVGLASLG